MSSITSLKLVVNVLTNLKNRGYPESAKSASYIVLEYCSGEFFNSLQNVAFKTLAFLGSSFCYKKLFKNYKFSEILLETSCNSLFEKLIWDIFPLKKHPQKQTCPMLNDSSVKEAEFMVPLKEWIENTVGSSTDFQIIFQVIFRFFISFLVSSVILYLFGLEFNFLYILASFCLQPSILALVLLFIGYQMTNPLFEKYSAEEIKESIPKTP